MITPEVLLAAGYSKHHHHEVVCDNTLYQKKVTDSDRKARYYINITFWDLAKHYPHTNAPQRIGVEVDARLYLAPGNTLVDDTGFTLKVHASDAATVEEVEAFYARAYSALSCDLDPHNND